MSRKTTPLYLVYAGHDLDAPVFRVVAGCPPSRRDLQSYEAQGASYNRRRFFRATGISVFDTREAAVAVGRQFGHGDSVAELRLDAHGVVWARTGRDGHITVWGAPEILAQCVVQCESYEH